MGENHRCICDLRARQAVAEGGWTAPEKNMRESVARVALAIGSLSLAVVIVLLVTGGFETTLWGRHVSLHNVRKPAIFTCALIAIWLLLSAALILAPGGEGGLFTDRTVCGHGTRPPPLLSADLKFFKPPMARYSDDHPLPL